MLPCSQDGSEWIMDSGLFSLMFGSEKGTLTTFDDFKSYALKYVSDMAEWGWNHAIVECDIQRVLGVKETHRLRDEVFRPSGREVIYVWHIPEGEAGLRALARNEKRIALSVPELRKELGAGSPRLKASLIRLLKIIREEGSPRVHLLGNTERALVTLPADSGDSTSWMAAGRYGEGYIFNHDTRTAESISIYSPKWKAWRSWCESHFAHSFSLLYGIWNPQSKQSTYYGNVACSAIAFLLLMQSLGEKGATPPAFLCAKPYDDKVNE